MTEISNPREVTYRCVVGHAVPASELDRLTAVTRLDGGAEVRLCREHGTPIAMTSRPGRTSHGELPSVGGD
jgi:hypothetical protein